MEELALLDQWSSSAPESALPPFRIQIHGSKLHVKWLQGRLANLEQTVAPANNVRLVPNVVYGDLQGSSVSRVDNPDRIGQTERRPEDRRSRIQIIAAVQSEKLRTNSKIYKDRGPRLNDHLSWHEQIKPTVRPVIGWIMAVKVVHQGFITDF